MAKLFKFKKNHEREKETKIVAGKTWVRYDGDAFWTCKEEK